MNINDIEPENEEPSLPDYRQDDIGDEYRAMAWEAGWASCAECGDWKEKHNLVEVNGYLYCPEHAPHFAETNDSMDYEALWNEAEAFIDGLAADQKSAYDEILSQWEDDPDCNPNEDEA